MTQPLPHRPPRQVSALPQTVPSATAAWPQTPAPSHWSVVHSLPSLAQGLPEALLDQAVALATGSQAWQSLAGLVAPAATNAPATRQPASQLPAWQYWPVPQAVPSATTWWSQAPLPSQASPVHGLPSSAQAPPAFTLDQSEALCAGSQRWHSLAGLAS